MSNNLFVESWNICSLSCVATGISRELPDRTNRDNVWEWGLLGELHTLLAPTGKRTMGQGLVKMLPSSQFLLRFSHFSWIKLFKLLQSFGVVSKVLKKLILTIFPHFQPDLTSALAWNLYNSHPDLQNSAHWSQDSIFNSTRPHATDPSWSLPLRANPCLAGALAFVPGLCHAQAFYLPSSAEAWRQEGLFSDYIIIFPGLTDWRLTELYISTSSSVFLIHLFKTEEQL